MTEAEWLVETNPATLLRHIITKFSQRKLTLYLCGGCRTLGHLFRYPAQSMKHIEIAECRADGVRHEKDDGFAGWEAEAATFGYDFEKSFYERDGEHVPFRSESITRLIEMGALAESALTGGEWIVNESVRHRITMAALLVEDCLRMTPHESFFHRLDFVDWPRRWLIDCVFGNPFRPVMFSPEWRSSDVVALAQSMYTSRDFDPMPILADALEEAGCDSDDILSHCSGSGPHARGCWVVDLVLGKS